MKKQNGFTLMELMIVVTIIGVLGAIAYPSYKEYMYRAQRDDAKESLLEIAAMLESYYLRYDKYTTSFAAPPIGLGVTAISPEGYYKYSLSSTDLIGNYTVTATAVSPGPQATDTRAGSTREGDCTVMELNSLGMKSAPNANDPFGTDPDILDCW